MTQITNIEVKETTALTQVNVGIENIIHAFTAESESDTFVFNFVKLNS